MTREIIEEAAENYNDKFQESGGSKPPHIKNKHIMNHFTEGAKWMEKQMYSEEDMLKCWNACERFERPISEGYAPNFNQFIENLKNK